MEPTQYTMHIGFITADLSHDHGWAHYSLELVTALVQAGINVTVVASRNSHDLDGVSIHRVLPNLVPRDRFLLPRLLSQTIPTRHILRDCDLIHCTVEPFAPLGALVANGRPFVQGGVGSYLQIGAWQRPPITALYRWAIGQSRIVCISHYTATVARAEFPHVPVDVVPLGIDPTRFVDLPKLDPPTTRPTVLTVGGIKPRKGTLHLVRAMATVRQYIPDVQCVILGSTRDGSDYTTSVRAEIDRHNLHDCVQLLGFVSDDELRAWYGAADVFVLPSMNEGWTFEGYGLVHMEASAAGLPVIGTWGCGVEDAIDDTVTGLLVSQQHIDEELPHAIIDILADTNRAAAMGAAGKARAQSQTWARVADQTIAIYQDMRNR